MQAREGVLERLNRHLTVELTAINQYFLQSEMCRNWGFERLYQKLRSLSMEEMQDAEKLVAHVLYLEGLPNMQRLNDVRVGESVEELFRLDLQTEREAVDNLREGIAHCAGVGDFTTRAMFEEMIGEEEGHVDWFETQLEAIRRVGIERYLAEQLHG
jgi:bacterioferritin